jgi:hypothetical protein
MFGPHDGRRVAVHPYRRMMAFLMRGRNQSAVYFEQHLDLTRTLPWLAERNARSRSSPASSPADSPDARSASRATLFHLILHGLSSVLHERERLNRFTIGHRTYQRTGVFLSFAAKKGMSDDAPLATVKRRFDRGESFGALVGELTTEIGGARSHTPSALDRELRILLALPGFLLTFLIALLRWLYAWGLAPRGLVDTDPLYTSAFVANLGSLKLDAAYHHLYEHGNCPLFVTIGQITHVPTVDGDRVVSQPQVTLRYTFDERVEDGLYCARSLQLLKQRIEDPAGWLAAE